MHQPADYWNTVHTGGMTLGYCVHGGVSRQWGMFTLALIRAVNLTLTLIRAVNLTLILTLTLIRAVKNVIRHWQSR